VDTTQPDVDAATAFYSELLGWELTGPGEMPGDPPGRYYVARAGGGEVAGIASCPPGQTGAAWNTYVSVDDADAAVRRATAAGATVVAPPFDAPPAGRAAVLTDPVGATLCLWQPAARQGAERVNEPGAWAMSMLVCADPQRAAAFYGEVFGWTTEPFGPATMLRLPGYEGGEPEQPVSREVIAVLGPPAEGPARWAVNFWVDDADGCAARAADLGGAIVAATDEPMRTMTLGDPQGGSFSVTTAPSAAVSA
jgi:predicted enzyme related to lactoylglutathione lyase